MTGEQRKALEAGRKSPERAKALEQFQYDDPAVMVAVGRQEKSAPWWAAPPVDPDAERRVIRTERCENASSAGWRTPWYRRPGILFRAWLRSWVAK